MKFLKTIWSLLAAMGEAKYAADLARGGKWREAQAVYRD